ncbi:hypothetical protein [Helicobacter pylori]|uniref:hypothetical protein n=1 Tax=Helicobacter pylori TaxID=210 RepID=UPI0009F079C9|nr:hypothetical protein [Helicobacter pylori]AVL49316.1 hypothetical protein CEP79_07285 [Helicobacter pylori]OQU75087.1 hypothetical protein BW246_02530 [Helicobacter pylori]OUJ20807.1 hypothetical protein BZL55_02415 [Helicobacter pylori]UGW75422.1 hypothetical protein LUA78_00640 [Helicobacter pylori]UGW82441.1 hypothetical protein LUA77_03105 [Helicobacter pylori]
MIKEIKVGGGLVLALYPYNRDFTGFEYSNAFNPTRLRKILLLDCRGKINPLVRAKCPIIRF